MTMIESAAQAHPDYNWDEDDEGLTAADLAPLAVAAGAAAITLALAGLTTWLAARAVRGWTR